MMTKLKKSIHYLCKGIKHLGDEEYMDYFLDRETDPNRLELNINSKANNSDRLLVIPEIGRGCGFFCEFNGMLENCYYADVVGFAPVIVWGESFLYKDPTIVECKNGFEYYFEQPTSYSDNDYKESKIYAYAREITGLVVTKTTNKFFDSNEEFERILADVYSKYIKLKPQINNRLNNDYIRIFGDCACEKTLGVHYRGTDFKENYDQHPISVQLEQTKKAIDEALINGNFEKIFLATDDKKALGYFRDIYGDRVVFYDDVYRGDNTTSVAFSEDAREHHKFNLGYEVLRDMYTLSRCAGLIAGVSQVSITARIVKKSSGNEWKYKKIINNGKNRNKKKFK